MQISLHGTMNKNYYIISRWELTQKVIAHPFGDGGCIFIVMLGLLRVAEHGDKQRGKVTTFTLIFFLLIPTKEVARMGMEVDLLFSC